jgi:hypothetical protein
LLSDEVAKESPFEGWAGKRIKTEIQFCREDKCGGYNPLSIFVAPDGAVTIETQVFPSDRKIFPVGTIRYQSTPRELIRDHEVKVSHADGLLKIRYETITTGERSGRQIDKTVDTIEVKKTSATRCSYRHSRESETSTTRWILFASVRSCEVVE